ncbi:hypothetical protein Goshw_023312, partial [Gossypium schwendimanii]|nr:hypothetical protein [Gossypium schwendimanii]
GAGDPTHPSVEFVAKLFLNPNQPLNETTHASLEAYNKLVVDLIKLLDKKVHFYPTVSLNRSMSGFIKRLVWVQKSFSHKFNKRMTK